MPLFNNLNFPENVFTLSFPHTIPGNFGKQIEHKIKNRAYRVNKCFWI